jgi:hypothetical protein
MLQHAVIVIWDTYAQKAALRRIHFSLSVLKATIVPVLLRKHLVHLGLMEIKLEE